MYSRWFFLGVIVGFVLLLFKIRRTQEQAGIYGAEIPSNGIAPTVTAAALDCGCGSSGTKNGLAPIGPPNAVGAPGFMPL